MKTAFIGHRDILANDISKRTTAAVLQEINNGCKVFTMGTHGEFDGIALDVCRWLRNTYKDLKIELVITSLNEIKKKSEFGIAPYYDVSTIMYEIENVHYKQQITISNRKMLDTCDTLICYVDSSAYRSGAVTALRYAEKKGLKIVNLFREEDNPCYGMTQEQIKEYRQKLAESILSKKE